MRTRKKRLSDKIMYKPTNYIDNKQTLSIYYHIVYLIVLLATIFGVKYGISENIDIFPLFTLPLVYISLFFLFRDYGVKESMKILKELNFIWITIPIIFYFIIWWLWLWLWNYFEGFRKLLDFKVFYINGNSLHIYNPELWLPVIIYISLYSFFAVGRQINMINTNKTSVLQKIVITPIFLLIDVFLGVLIFVVVMISVLSLVFILKPHYLQYVMPTIGLVLALILLALSLLKKIKQYSLYYIVSTVITVILCILIWQKDRQYDYVSEYSEGFAIVKNDQSFNYDRKDYHSIIKYGFIDKQGKEVIPLKYDEVKPFSDGFAIVALDSIYMGYSERMYGFIDKTAKEITEIKYLAVKPFAEGEGLAAVKKRASWGFIDKTGKEVIPLKYKSANSFINGRAKVSIVIDHNDSYTRSLSYAQQAIFIEEHFFYIDKTGKEIEYIFR
jgi:hypothetical protein